MTSIKDILDYEALPEEVRRIADSFHGDRYSAGYETAVDEMRSEISGLEDDIEELEDDKRRLENEITQLEDKIAELEDKLLNLSDD